MRRAVTILGSTYGDLSLLVCKENRSAATTHSGWLHTVSQDSIAQHPGTGFSSCCRAAPFLPNVLATKSAALLLSINMPHRYLPLKSQQGLNMAHRATGINLSRLPVINRLASKLSLSNITRRHPLAQAVRRPSSNAP